MAFRDVQFPWLQEVNGRYEHPGESNNSPKPTSIANDKPKKKVMDQLVISWQQ